DSLFSSNGQGYFFIFCTSGHTIKTSSARVFGSPLAKNSHRQQFLPVLLSPASIFLVSDSLPPSSKMVLQNDVDLLNPPAELEKRKHKLKRLVQSPNSFFMDVKCQGCFNITTVFSHSQTVVVCGSCQTVLCQPTGGRARLTEGCSFRKKGD
ncbi:40S ribosomal protein S27-2, partial [Linum grandiflorum]